MKVIIVEDEKPAADRLQQMLADFPDVELLAVADTGEEAAREIDRLRPEVIFLDVQLPDLSGVDLLRLIEHQPQVIFTTAYDTYAVQAFELGAVDYLLKPFSRERLAEALERVRARLAAPENATRKLEQLLSQLAGRPPYLQRIPCRAGQKILILNADQILYFATENKLVFAHLADRRYCINYTLEELQHRLDPERFFRTHRTTIVNLDFVRSIEPWFGGTYRITLRDREGTQLPVSRNAARQLREKLGW
ncbi:MAG: DNA-binding response regulator [Calditrichaeota bacterium]|nr:MAG: DNA-binding response regulator [Calditrichota bacterium]